jgi:exosortase A-associated hydrolase 1
MAAPTERFLIFDCDGDACVGVLAVSLNRNAPPEVGIVIIVGGPQYRVGSHRQFTLLSRAVAESGVPVLRFDYRGMGDSEGERRTFESIDRDVATAIDALQRETHVSRVVLWGLCDGASAALMYAQKDRRIAGIVAINPWVRSCHGEASTRLKHYYLRRLFSRSFWSKLARGDFNVQDSRSDFVDALRRGLGDPMPIDDSDYLRRMQQGWERFQRPVLFILSGNDFTAREFEGWVNGDRDRRRLFQSLQSEILIIENADHTFSNGVWRDRVAQATAEWLQQLNLIKDRASG